MCTKEEVREAVKLHSTPKWVNNLLVTLSTVAVMLLGGTLTTVLDNKDNIQKSKTSVVRQFSKAKNIENERYAVLTSTISTLSSNVRVAEEITKLRCNNLESNIKAIRTIIKERHPTRSTP